MTQTVADLMTPDPFAVIAENTLQDAHNLMKEKNVRHIPVIDEAGALVGMLTQKIMIAKVMGIMATYGANALARKEKQTKVQDIMATDFASVRPSQSLQEGPGLPQAFRHAGPTDESSTELYQGVGVPSPQSLVQRLGGV